MHIQTKGTIQDQVFANITSSVVRVRVLPVRATSKLWTTVICWDTATI